MASFNSIHMNYKSGNATVTFEAYPDKAIASLATLTALALTDIGKFLTRTMKLGLLKYVPSLRGTKMARSSFQYWVRKVDCDLQVGTGNLQKAANGENWYGYRQEQGTPGIVSQGRVMQASVPRWGIITDTVNDNIDVIRQITEQYLGRMSDEDPVAGVDQTTSVWISSPDDD